MNASPAFLGKIVSRAQAPARVAELRHQGPVVFTNGVFDVMHRGHVTYLAQARALVGDQADHGLLVLTDIFGATPANVAQKLVQGTAARLISGVNLPMLYRAVCYREEGLEALVARAISGSSAADGTR